MNRIWILIRKDLLRRAKSPLGVLVLMAIPLVISLIFGLVFSPSGKQELPRLTMLLVDRDKSLGSQFVKSAFSQGDLARMIELREVEPAEGERLMAGGEATALLEIPPGFGVDLLDGKPATLRLVKNPAEMFLPEVAQKVTEITALLLDYGVRVLADPLREIRADSRADRFPDEAAFLGTARLFRDRLDKVRKFVMPPVIELKAEEQQPEEGPRPEVNFFALFLPGIAIFSLLFLAETAFRDLAAEHAGGQLRRISASPVRAAEILLAKFGYAWLLVFSSFVLMMVVGVLAFGIRFRSPLLFLAGGACSALACVGVMALIHSFLAGQRGGEAFTSIVVVVMSMLGGSFMPLDSLPSFFQWPARFTVNYWSIDLLRGALNAGLPAGDPLRAALVLTGVGLVATALGALQLGRQLRRGVAR